METSVNNFRRVLIAEDEAVTRRMMERVVRSLGAEHVELVENGAEALRRATYHHFDLVLMDLIMPVMDGYDATRELRRRGYLRPIVAVTASVIEDAVVRCAEAGCDSCIPKPVSAERLKLSLSNITRH